MEGLASVLELVPMVIQVLLDRLKQEIQIHSQQSTYVTILNQMPPKVLWTILYQIEVAYLAISICV